MAAPRSSIPLNERRHVFYLANRDRLREVQRDYRAKNRALLCEKAKLYNQRRFFHIRARNLAARHLEESSASTQELAGLWKKQRAICPFTGIRLNRHNAQLDHITPLVRGGSGMVANLRWIHRDANYAKRDLSDAQFIELCQKVAAIHRKEKD